jgi:hypothetical protein
MVSKADEEEMADKRSCHCANDQECSDPALFWNEQKHHGDEFHDSRAHSQDTFRFRPAECLGSEIGKEGYRFGSS